jgi:hypothetical protein
VLPSHERYYLIYKVLVNHLDAIPKPQLWSYRDASLQEYLKAVREFTNRRR